MAGVAQQAHPGEMLTEDGELRCPRCTASAPAADYLGKFEQKDWARRWTVPVCCCPGCNWKFAVRPEVLEAAA